MAEELGAVPVLSTVAGLHDPEPDTDLGHELSRVFEWLRLDDINEDLEVIVESGDLSPEMSSRYRELDAERGRLKALLAKASEAPAH